MLLAHQHPQQSTDLCVPFSLVQTHDSHRGTSLDCRGDVENIPTGTVAVSHKLLLQSGVWHCHGGEWFHTATCQVSWPLLHSSSDPGFHHSGLHWWQSRWVTSLSAKVCDDWRTMSASPYQHWVWCNTFSNEITNASTADSCVQSPDRSADTRTHPLRQYDPQILSPLFHTTAGCHESRFLVVI